MINTRQNSSAKYWAVVPAAGVGRRMGGEIPKQYLRISDQTVIEHSVGRLLACAEIQAVMIAIGKDDAYFQDTMLPRHERVFVTIGGAERRDSVLKALQALQGKAKPDDWVLVHDAARPCIDSTDIQALIDYTKQSSTVEGAVLGIPVRDTMKHSDANAQIINTVDRNNLWHAHTPQVFRLGQLQQALQLAISQGKPVTDEASAMELAGFSPRMIVGQASNIKITLPSDLELAKFFLNDKSTKQQRAHPIKSKDIKI